MHKGKAYHDFMLASPQDVRVRKRFQDLVSQLAPPGGTILDFGAGTGIDAKSYVARQFKVLVYEPDEENRKYLTEHCRAELANGDIALTDLTVNEGVHVITANFAVLNLIADHRSLFATFNRLLAPDGHVVVNLLNPFFVGDARYGWWRENLGQLLRNGSYMVEGDDGDVHRFTPAAVARAAQPEFLPVAMRPSLLGLAFSQYMFMVFRKKG